VLSITICGHILHGYGPLREGLDSEGSNPREHPEQP